MSSSPPHPPPPDTGSQSPPSPTASFYDMSDDEEGEYNTIRHTTSGRGVKLLYSKSKVRFACRLPSKNTRVPGSTAPPCAHDSNA